jgi:transposase
VCIEVQKGRSINLFGLISRSNEFIYKTSEKNINSDFIVEFLDDLSLKVSRKTVLVLDNASIHKAKKVQVLLDHWQKRGLYIFFLPPYSPQLNIAERLWKEIKERWIKPSDYIDAESLFYAVDRIYANIGKTLNINFSKCSF